MCSQEAPSDSCEGLVERVEGDFPRKRGKGKNEKSDFEGLVQVKRLKKTNDTLTTEEKEGGERGGLEVKIGYRVLSFHPQYGVPQGERRGDF